MLDQDFGIERPKRVYRTGFHFMTGKGSLRAHKDSGDTIANAVHPDHQDAIDEDHPFAQEMMIQSGEGKGDAADQLHDDNEHHASQHTFFIQNSQRKLKLVTKNAVSIVHKQMSMLGRARGPLLMGSSARCTSLSCRWSA